jgi:hypothetical protein
MSDDNNEAAAASTAEIPMALPVSEQVPEETQHTARARKPRGRKAAEPEQIGSAVDEVLNQAQANGNTEMADGEVPNEPKKPFQVVRGWTSRTQQPVKYQKFSDANMKIVAFKFDLPKDGTGKEEPMPEPVLTLLRDNKKDENGNDTGLRFENTRKHGKIWMVPNDPEGRALADKLDYHLGELAHKMDSAMAARA